MGEDGDLRRRISTGVASWTSATCSSCSARGGRASRAIGRASTGAGDDDLAVANGSRDDVWVFLNEGDRIGVET